jgi:hypothetical protein
MNAIIIPIQNSSCYTEEVTIDGLLYIFTFWWNVRGKFWSLAIDDSLGNNIVSGLKVITNIDLFFRFNKITLPQGITIPRHETGESLPILEGSLGDSINIIHIDKADSGI